MFIEISGSLVNLNNVCFVLPDARSPKKTRIQSNSSPALVVDLNYDEVKREIFSLPNN